MMPLALPCLLSGLPINNVLLLAKDALPPVLALAAVPLLPPFLTAARGLHLLWIQASLLAVCGPGPQEPSACGPHPFDSHCRPYLGVGPARAGSGVREEGMEHLSFRRSQPSRIHGSRGPR